MRTDDPKAIELKDYTPAPFTIRAVALDFHLDADATRVKARLTMERRAGTSGPLRLDGEGLKLIAIAVDGAALGEDAYSVDDTGLTLHAPGDSFTLETETEIAPAANTALEGLYMSSGMFCTQCEAQGFRRITYFLDRPDVMSIYTVRIEADQARFPVLLSNGNPGESGTLGDGRHYALWHDPHPKPSYLFALVAGDLGHIEDSFTTSSGRSVALCIYTTHGNEPLCTYAMDALKRSMVWDEEVFGREYDLDVFNIVAVNDFNAGAMENKGLNIFNDALVFASPETATDLDYERIERVVAHEYFHNWTGNRITCRDWFQLCLKEGLTVFRDQQFGADMREPNVSRIDDVNRLRTIQFPEDAGGLAHPVRPGKYIKIDNFYTATVYEKGSELVRMIHALIGEEAFRKGMDIYFAEHDNTAATVEDFVGSFEKASGRDMSAFMRWYAQAGTPRVTARGQYDADAKTYTLTLTQNTPATPGQPDKSPVPIPVRMGLIGADGGEVPLKLEGDNAGPEETTRVLELREAEQSFTFRDVAARPVPSLLRGFSAPVILESDLTTQDSIHLIAHDTDAFNRWEAAHHLAKSEIAHQAGGEPPRDSLDALIGALGTAMETGDLDPAFLARLITPPREEDVAQMMNPVDPGAIHQAHRAYRSRLARKLRTPLTAALESVDRSQPFRPDADQAGRRALANAALSLLSEDKDAGVFERITDQAMNADNMTDRLAGLSVLSHLDVPERQTALDAFYAQWQDNPLVVDKWFALQARSTLPDTPARVRELSQHPAYKLRNPNRVRALVGAFVLGNPVRFHDPSGAGYDFYAEQILAVDRLNPQFAGRLAGLVKTWRALEPGRRERIKACFERVLNTKPISDNLYEVMRLTLDG